MNSDILILALGSNLGDREAFINRAVNRLEEVFGPALQRTEAIESQAIGFDGPAFLDALAVFRCTLEPLEVLAVCKRIEREMGRTDEPEYDAEGNRIYHDRIIDIDILMYGDRKLSLPRLVIPHRAIDTRPYITELLLTLRPL